MNIEIDADRCVGCGKCLDVCPGNLLTRSKEGKAQMLRGSECWACTACMKECAFGAITYRFGPDLDGRGACLHVRSDGTRMIWSVTKKHRKVKEIVTDSRESNTY